MDLTTSTSSVRRLVAVIDRGVDLSISHGREVFELTSFLVEE